MQETFCENTNQNDLCKNNEFIQPRVRSVNDGSDSVRFKGPQLWQTLPPTIRNSESYHLIKKIKNCREKIVHVGYAAHLFPTWAFYDEDFSISGCLILMICKYFITIICNICIL